MVDNITKPIDVKYITNFDGSVFPICPSCGEIAYEYDHCLFCGQRFNIDSFHDEDDMVTVRISPEGKITVEGK